MERRAISILIHRIMNSDGSPPQDLSRLPDLLKEDLSTVLHAAPEPRYGDTGVSASRSRSHARGQGFAEDLALGYWVAGEFDRSMQWLRRGLRVAPADARLRFLAVSVALRQGRPLEAACHLMHWGNSCPGAAHPESAPTLCLYEFARKHRLGEYVVRWQFRKAQDPWLRHRSNGRIGVVLEVSGDRPSAMLLVCFAVPETDATVDTINAELHAHQADSRVGREDDVPIRFRYVSCEPDAAQFSAYRY